MQDVGERGVGDGVRGDKRDGGYDLGCLSAGGGGGGGEGG